LHKNLFNSKKILSRIQVFALIKKKKKKNLMVFYSSHGYVRKEQTQSLRWLLLLT